MTVGKEKKKVVQFQVDNDGVLWVLCNDGAIYYQNDHYEKGTFERYPYKGMLRHL